MVQMVKCSSVRVWNVQGDAVSQVCLVVDTSILWAGLGEVATDIMSNNVPQKPCSVYALSRYSFRALGVWINDHQGYHLYLGSYEGTHTCCQEHKQTNLKANLLTFSLLRAAAALSPCWGNANHANYLGKPWFLHGSSCTLVKLGIKPLLNKMNSAKWCDDCPK